LLATLRQRNFALLWLAGLVSVAGDFALIVALPLHAYALTGSAVATGGVFAASLLPRIVLGSLAGVFVDRWDRQRTMVTADLLRAALLLPLLVVASAEFLWLVYLVRVSTSMLALLFNPAESALLPRLVGEEQLVTANALNALNNNLGRLIGPAAGGLLYAAGGLPIVVLADAASFVGSAVLILLIRTDAHPERTLATTGSSAARQFFGEWLAGLRLIRRDPVLVTLFTAFCVGFVGEGTFEVGFIPFAVDVLDGGAEVVGILLSAQAIGGIVAGAVIARVAILVSPRVLFAGGLSGLGLVDLGLANATALAPPGLSPVVLASAFMILAGLPSVAGIAAGNGLLQTLTVDAFRGRVFGALEAAYGLATLLGLAAGGAAIDSLGVVPVLIAGAGMWMLGGVVALLRLPREAGTATSGEQSSIAP
jgi:predicted MFS family arabinose efflux permease